MATIRETLARLIAPDEPLGAGMLTTDGETKLRAVTPVTHPFLRGLPDDGGTLGAALDKPFAASAWVQSAIKIVATPITTVPLRFSEQGRGGDKLYENPALDAFWQAPAVGPKGLISCADFLEAAVGWLKLAGECFFLLDDSWLLPRGERTPFIIARPDSMREIVNEVGRVAGWRYRDNRGREYILLAEQVVHVAFWNPYHPIRGLSEYEAAQIAAEADFAAGRFARDLARNNGDRGVIVTSKHPLSEPQQKQANELIKQKREAAIRGEFRPVFLSGDVSIAEPAIKSADAEFLTQRLENRKEIYAAFGVPGSFAEAVATYSIGSASDRFRLIEDTCEPLGNKICGQAVAPISAKFEMRPPTRPLFAWLDFGQHSVMRQARREGLDALGKLAGLGMPAREASNYLGLGLPRFEGDEVGHLPFNVVTVESANADVTPPAPALPAPKKSEPSAVERLVAFLTPRDPVERALEILDAPPILQLEDNPPAPSAPPEPDDGDEARRAADWRRYMVARRPYEKAAQKKVKSVLMQARATVLGKLEKAAKSRGLGAIEKDDKNPAPGTAQLYLFDERWFSDELIDQLERAHRVAMQAAGEEVFSELGLENPWTTPPDAVLNALRDRENLLRLSSAEMFEEIKTELEAGFVAGESTAELAARIRSKFNELAGARAESIAVTETGAAYGRGRQSAMQAAGVRRKRWLSARDKRVRPTHWQADGQTVAIDEVFAVGGDRMLTPCTGSIAAENVGCRCVSQPLRDGEK